MTFEEAHAEFSVRYYLWALEEFRVEIQEGFPLLKRLDTQPSKTCVRLMQQLSVSDQSAFANALVKRFHRQAMTIVGDTLSPDDTQMIQNYIDSGLITSPEEDAVWDRRLAGDPALKLNRKVFTKTLKDFLFPVLGPDIESRGNGEWGYNCRIGSFQAYTRLDVGGRFHQLCYSHDIVFSGYQLLVERASVLS